MNADKKRIAVVERERERETAAAVAAGGAVRRGDRGADSGYAGMFDVAGRKKRWV